MKKLGMGFYFKAEKLHGLGFLAKVRRKFELNVLLCSLKLVVGSHC